MQMKDLIKNSPIRTFDKALGGGLKKGELGVLVSRSGTGKTGCIVHLATDAMMQGKKIIHVSFSENVENTVNWYKEVFRQISAATGKSSSELYEDVSRNRVILTFSEKTPMANVLKTIEAVATTVEGGVAMLIFDGYKLTIADEKDVKQIKDFAKKLKVGIWAAVTPVRKEAVVNEFGIPDTISPYMDLIDVLVGLKTDESAKKVRMTIAKAGGKEVSSPMKVVLDPQTMLIVE